MKKIFVMLVTMFVMLTANAQIITGFTQAGEIAILSNGMRVNITQYPGWNHFTDRLTIQENVNRYFQNLYRDNPDEYALEARAYGFGGMMAGNGMMIGNGMMGVGYGMYGNGMQNTGMVGGAMGMAGAQSNVIIDNSNLAETIGSGVTMSYDTGSNSLSINGDFITAGLRLASAIGSKTKKNKSGFQNGQILQDANGNKYIINNGVLVPVQQQTTRSYNQQPVQQVQYQQQTTRSAQPVQQSVQQTTRNQQVQPQTTNYGGGVATSTVYNVASGF